MVSHTLVWWAQALVILAGLALLWRGRRDLADGWRRRLTDLQAAAVPGGGAPSAGA
jgi:hypothetical protein